MQVRSPAPVATACAIAPMVLGAALLAFAWLPTTLAASQQTTSSTTNPTSSLPPGAFLQGITSTPLPPATSTPTPQPTATPTVVPTSPPVANSVATLSPVGTLASTPGTPSTTPTPFSASLVGTPTTSVAASPVSPDSSTSASTSPLTGPQGLPPSAIFVPGGSGAPSVSAPASSPSLAGPVDLVVDAAVGGTVALPDNSLRLVVPAGVADTDSLLVSLSEVPPTSSQGNLQVGTRLFAVTLVDSGGASITNFGTPILLTATSIAPATGKLILALDPDSGQFNPLATVPQRGGQVAGSLDKLAAPTTGTAIPPDLSLTIAQASSSTQVTRPSTPVGGDAAQQILNSLGLAP